MLIPKCCKGCSGRKSGMCNCTLPSYCNEWVEDDETYPTNVGGVINTPNTAPADIKIGDQYPCGVDGTNTETQKNWWNGTWRNYEQGIGNWTECPDCKEKDHRIAELEKENKTLKNGLISRAKAKKDKAQGIIITPELFRTMMEQSQRIAVLEKALELACQELRDEYCRHCDAVNGGCTRFEMCDKVWNMYPKQDFIEQAEKELEDETK